MKFWFYEKITDESVAVLRESTPNVSLLSAISQAGALVGFLKITSGLCIRWKPVRRTPFSPTRQTEFLQMHFRNLT